MNSIIVWVLISISTGYYNKGSTAAVATFESKEECQKYQELSRNWPDVRTHCFPSRIFYK